MDKQEIINEVLRVYDLGLTYLQVDYKGFDVKFRINKDHARG